MSFLLLCLFLALPPLMFALAREHIEATKPSNGAKAKSAALQ
jgi:hypothetical protein